MGKQKMPKTFLTLENIALKLYAYFSLEEEAGSLRRSIHDPKGRVRDILNVKKCTLNRWIRTSDGSGPLMSAGPKRKLDSFDLDVIKREIIRFSDSGNLLTLKKLKQSLKTNNDIYVGKTTLWRAVRRLGFTFRGTAGLKNVLCEREKFVRARSEYLRKVKKHREDGYDIVYLDETYVNVHHTANKEWVSRDGSIRRNVPSGKGQRVIVAHAGSGSTGFVPGAGLVFTSVSTDNRDYHSEMNADIFGHWMRNSLLPALERPTCIVMDNASYHCVVATENKIPTSSTKKADIQAWLERENVNFERTMLKAELVDLVRSCRKKKQFEIDDVIHQHGHTCLRLPPYHSHLNPIELVWAKVKGQVADQNKTFKLDDIKTLTQEALGAVDKEYWRKCVEHVKNIESDYWRKEGLQFIHPPVIIPLSESSESE